MRARSERPLQRLVGARGAQAFSVDHPLDQAGARVCGCAQRKRLILTAKGGIDQIDGTSWGIRYREMRVDVGSGFSRTCKVRSRAGTVRSGTGKVRVKADPMYFMRSVMGQPVFGGPLTVNGRPYSQQTVFA